MSAAPDTLAAPAREHPLRLVASGDEPVGAAPLGAGVVRLLWGSVLVKLVFALSTGFVLVDDAYIHLRYARNLVETGAFVYNAGEPVFGLTSPLYGLVCALLYAISGPFVEHAVLLSNVALWTGAAVLIARRLPVDARLAVSALFLLAPVFVDNQLLGMETPLFVLLLVGAVTSAREGRARASAAWYGLALVTRPEAVLLAPFLLLGLASHSGWRASREKLLQPRTLAALLAPGVAWVTYALLHYGSIVPQSMQAKTGWNNEHYDALFDLRAALLTAPRLTFLPFLDYFPSALAWALTASVWAALAWVVRANIRGGDADSRLWLGFYLVYLAFYIAGKGATEASWYAVPASVAFLLAARPALPGWLRAPGPRTALALVAVLLATSLVSVQRRGPLLRSYVAGYGACADALEAWPSARPAATAKVVIGEIGVFGFRTSHPVVDVGALVSPEVLPWKNAGYSFCRIVQEADADYFVISNIALENNHYPSVGAVWANDEERRWWEERCRPVHAFLDKQTFEVARP